jgi:hypothetical protein
MSNPNQQQIPLWASIACGSVAGSTAEVNINSQNLF